MSINNTSHSLIEQHRIFRIGHVARMRCKGGNGVDIILICTAPELRSNGEVRALNHHAVVAILKQRSIHPNQMLCSIEGPVNSLTIARLTNGKQQHEQRLHGIAKHGLRILIRVRSLINRQDAGLQELETGNEEIVIFNLNNKAIITNARPLTTALDDLRPLLGKVLIRQLSQTRFETSPPTSRDNHIAGMDQSHNIFLNGEDLLHELHDISHRNTRQMTIAINSQFLHSLVSLASLLAVLDDQIMHHTLQQIVINSVAHTISDNTIRPEEVGEFTDRERGQRLTLGNNLVVNILHDTLRQTEAIITTVNTSSDVCLHIQIVTGYKRGHFVCLRILSIIILGLVLAPVDGVEVSGVEFLFSFHVLQLDLGTAILNGLGLDQTSFSQFSHSHLGQISLLHLRIGITIRDLLINRHDTGMVQKHIESTLPRGKITNDSVIAKLREGERRSNCHLTAQRLGDQTSSPQEIEHARAVRGTRAEGILQFILELGILAGRHRQQDDSSPTTHIETISVTKDLGHPLIELRRIFERHQPRCTITGHMSNALSLSMCGEAHTLQAFDVVLSTNKPFVLGVFVLSNLTIGVKMNTEILFQHQLLEQLTQLRITPHTHSQHMHGHQSKGPLFTVNKLPSQYPKCINAKPLSRHLSRLATNPLVRLSIMSTDINTSVVTSLHHETGFTINPIPSRLIGNHSQRSLATIKLVLDNGEGLLMEHLECIGCLGLHRASNDCQHVLRLHLVHYVILRRKMNSWRLCLLGVELSLQRLGKVANVHVFHAHIYSLFLTLGVERNHLTILMARPISLFPFLTCYHGVEIATSGNDNIINNNNVPSNIVLELHGHYSLDLLTIFLFQHFC